MPSSFTSSQQKQTQTQNQNFNQSTQLPSAFGAESGLQDQLYGLAGTQAQSLASQTALQNALMNPQQTLLQLQQPAKSQQEIESAMRQQFGNDLVDRFNAGGGTGKGLTESEFQAIRNAQRQFAGSDLRDMGPDLVMKLQQQLAQNQMGQQAQAQFLDRMQNPYGLSAQEQQGIQDVYDNQRKQAMYNLNLGIQDLATSRGLNKYDSPVANEAARQAALMESNIGAAQSADLLNRGEANRNFGLNLIGQNANLNQMGFNNQVGLSQMLPTANTFLQPLLAQNRFAQPTTSGSSSGSMSGTMTSTPSQMSTMLSGIGALGGLAMGAGLGLGGGGLTGGLSGIGGGPAGTAVANQMLGQMSAAQPAYNFSGLSGTATG